MKKIVFIALAWVALLRADPGAYFPEGWKLGTVFPSPPKVGTRQLDNGGTMFVAFCSTPSEAFIASRTRYAAVIEATKQEGLFEAGKAAMLSSMAADLESEKVLTLCGYPARRYTLREKNGLKKAKCYVVLAGDELYQFMHAAKSEVEDSPAVKAFFAGITALPGNAGP